MSYEALKRIFENSTVTGSTRLVLLAIAFHESKEGYSWPSINRLADYVQLSYRQVNHIINKLEKAGELAIVHNRGRHKSNVYTILSGLEEGEKQLARIRIDGLAELVTSEKSEAATSDFQPKKQEDITSGLSQNKSDIATSGFSIKPEVSGGKPEVSDGKPEVATSDESLIRISNESKKNITDIWDDLSLEFLQRGGRALWENYAKFARPIGWTGDVFRVSVANDITRDMLESRFGAILNRRLPGLTNRPAARVEFITGGAL